MTAWQIARDAKLALAAVTDTGRVPWPGGRMIGRLAAYTETYERPSRVFNGNVTRTRTAWRIIPESRQMRRAQDRREDKQ